MKPPRNIPALLLALSLCLTLAACSPGGSQTSTQPSAPASQGPSPSAPAQASEPAGELADAEIQVFIAASLENAFQDIIALYGESQPNITVTYCADSSGTLLSQIQEGFECDIFFSAGARQIDELERSGLAMDGTRVDLLQNKVALITYKGSGTSVTTLSEIGSASSVALAGSSVPVGQYTRTALQALGILDSGRDAADFTAQEVSEALGGVEINETANVSATLNAVAEGSNEVGTVYYSDAYSRIDDVEILELVDSSLSEIGSASSVALAGSSVPVGQYTRTALQALGILDSGRDAADFTAQEVSEALGGVEINETANVSATLNAVAEGSNEVGTVYYSDAYSRIDDVEILELVDSSLTGDIIYPMSRVVNAEADQAQAAAADDFYAFLQTDAVMDIFERYLFVSNLEG